MENLTFNRVIDLIKERHGLKSDYAFCKAFDLSPQNVSGWRKERSYPDEKMCGILAYAAGIDPLVLAFPNARFTTGKRQTRHLKPFGWLYFWNRVTASKRLIASCLMRCRPTKCLVNHSR